MPMQKANFVLPEIKSEFCYRSIRYHVLIEMTNIFDKLQICNSWPMKLSMWRYAKLVRTDNISPWRASRI